MVDANPDQWPLRRGSLIYPLPVATACGRVLRARNASERVNACLKAAEVLARYLAAVALSSFTTRSDEGEAKLSDLHGNLSFGHFLTTVQEVAGSKVDHPASALLAQGFKKTKGNKEILRGKTDSALVELLELRNGLGHELRNLNEAKAVAIEAGASPLTRLFEALNGVESLLAKPLFVVEHQEWTREALVVRRLLLMGESADPTPQTIRLETDAGVGNTGTPYIAINKLCLPLPPSLLWGIDQGRQNYALLFLDAVEEHRARYCTLDGGSQAREDNSAKVIRSLLGGDRQTADTVVLVDGRHLAREWSEVRDRIEASGQRQEGFVDWGLMEERTLSWLARRLGASEGDLPSAVITAQLLDGRTSIDAVELRQLHLLLGRAEIVRREVGRDIIDLRAVKDSDARWDERELVESDNLLEALRKAVAFFSRHVSADGVTLDGLASTTGSADYIAIREALVNQFIHQDYADRSAAAQIEVRPDCAVLFNTGYSLVDQDALVDGGKSQSRNPLVARALRLVGFAELAGSGIRALQHAWRQANRLPPRFTSDRKANTFTLNLDWRPLPNSFDEKWRNRIGVRLTNEQAIVLNLALDRAGIVIAQAASATGFSLAEAKQVLDHLLRQVLIEEREGRFYIKEHLRELSS